MQPCMAHLFWADIMLAPHFHLRARSLAGAESTRIAVTVIPFDAPSIEIVRRLRLNLRLPGLVSVNVTPSAEGSVDAVLEFDFPPACPSDALVATLLAVLER